MRHQRFLGNKMIKAGEGFFALLRTTRLDDRRNDRQLEEKTHTAFLSG
jgi:hypothetical protein